MVLSFVRELLPFTVAHDELSLVSVPDIADSISFQSNVEKSTASSWAFFRSTPVLFAR